MSKTVGKKLAALLEKLPANDRRMIANPLVAKKRKAILSETARPEVR
jgi:hypothetical protein